MAALNDQSTFVEPVNDETRQAPPVPVPAANEPLRRSLTRGAVLGRYVIIERIGAGGFGEVFAAYDPDLDRKVALKLMKTRANRLGSARAQLLREAQALAKLSHDNVTTIYDFGDFEDDVYLSMEFVDGQTLKEWFAEEPRTWQDVREVMVAAGRGLAAAHSAGIIHSDFKPHNVLVDGNGHVSVADFGLARALSQFEPPEDLAAAQLAGHDTLRRRRGTTIPTVGSKKGREPIAGSPAYMSPEQFRRMGVDERSDQFAFCVTLFEGLFGRRPFPQTNFAELRTAIEEGRMTDPPDDVDVPRWLRDVVLRGLSHEAHDRFESMDELLAALTADPEAKRRQRLILSGTAAVSATAALVVATLLRTEPTLGELGHIDSLVVEARAAASRNYFVHPPVDMPGVSTAYTKVLELENLDGVFDPQADESAQTLRKEFAETLTRTGDYYWEAEYGKSFALDYYAQAIIFDPNHPRASERSSTTPGELASLRKKAANLGFTRGELIAAEPLAALATREIGARAEKLRRLVKKRHRRSTTGQESLDTMSRIVSALAKSKTVHGGPVKAAGTRDATSGKTDGETASLAPNSGVEPTAAAQGPDITERFEQPLPAADADIVQRALAREPVRTRPRSGEPRGRGDHASDTRATPRVDHKLAAKLVAEGVELADGGHYKKAAQAFHRALKSHRRSPSALMGLSNVYFEQGNFRRAVEYGERAVALDPKRKSYRISLGDAYMRTHQYKEAIEQYEYAAKRGSKAARRRLRVTRKKFGE